MHHQGIGVPRQAAQLCVPAPPGSRASLQIPCKKAERMFRSRRWVWRNPPRPQSSPPAVANTANDMLSISMQADAGVGPCLQI